MARDCEFVRSPIIKSRASVLSSLWWFPKFSSWEESREEEESKHSRIDIINISFQKKIRQSIFLYFSSPSRWAYVRLIDVLIPHESSWQSSTQKSQSFPNQTTPPLTTQLDSVKSLCMEQKYGSVLPSANIMSASFCRILPLLIGSC